MLLHVAFGDWQVSELSAFVAARTMGIPVHQPVTAAGRSREVEPGWGLEPLTYPSAGSALVVWDSGSDPIPVENVPPSTGRDPHSDPRRDPDVQQQKAAFLFDGQLIDVCGAAACPADAELRAFCRSARPDRAVTKRQNGGQSASSAGAIVS